MQTGLAALAGAAASASRRSTGGDSTRNGDGLTGARS
ncbi:hypothetical protein EV379_2827 [Microterricola gilva]|uniref:Uncharacterized protein n=1 Tax=Microterricola gilva TaxID=393267 RepID=A0A4Q8AQZ7_9MICO|nr:hypothetical protein EV379_2827 [Microterricola gilva]